MLENPIVLGCEPEEAEVFGRCDHCGEIIYKGYEAYTDNNNYLYCSQECAIAEHGIEEYQY